MKFLKGVLALIICIAVVYFGYNYTLKKSIDPEDFKKIMEDNSYTVSQIYKNKEAIEKAYVASKLKEDYNWDIEFIKFETKEDAIAYYETEQAKMENIQGVKSYDRFIKGLNYDQYMLESNLEYKSISRIDDTIVYASATSKAKIDVREIITNLGYWLVIDDNR